VADGLMEFRFAIPTAELDGDFHDKFGIFGDDAGQRVSFLGSYNDTMKGHRTTSQSMFSSHGMKTRLILLMNLSNALLVFG